MSGFVERIVRRRRASASSRLGPGSLNGSLGMPHTNGGAPEVHVNGADPVTAEPELAVVTAPEEEVAAEPEFAVVTAPEEEVAAEPELAVVTAPEEEVAAEPEADIGAEPEEVAAEPLAAPARLPAAPGFIQRGRLRRRARYLRRLREVQLRDLGGFLVELRRYGRERPDLVEAKLTGALGTDAELRALHGLLDAEPPLRELREVGIGGACRHCGAVHGSRDRYCASCGESLRGGEPDSSRGAAE